MYNLSLNHPHVRSNDTTFITPRIPLLHVPPWQLLMYDFPAMSIPRKLPYREWLARCSKT